MNAISTDGAHAALDRLLAKVEENDRGERQDDDIDIVREALFNLDIGYRLRGDILRKVQGRLHEQDDADPICDCGNEDCIWTAEPYAQEIHGVEHMQWICDSCYSRNCDDI